MNNGKIIRDRNSENNNKKLEEKDVKKYSNLPNYKIFKNEIANQKILSYLKLTKTNNLFLKLGNEEILRKYADKLNNQTFNGTFKKSEHFKLNFFEPDEIEMKKAIIIRKIDLNKRINSSYMSNDRNLLNERSSFSHHNINNLNFNKSRQILFPTGIPFSNERLKNSQGNISPFKKHFDENKLFKINLSLNEKEDFKRMRNIKVDLNLISKNTLTLDSNAFSSPKNKLTSYNLDINTINENDTKQNIVNTDAVKSSTKENKNIIINKIKEKRHFSANSISKSKNLNILLKIKKKNLDLKNHVTDKILEQDLLNDNSKRKIKIIKSPFNKNNVSKVELEKKELEIKINRINEEILKKLNLDDVYIHPESRIYNIVNSLMPLEIFGNNQNQNMNTIGVYKNKKINKIQHKEISSKFKNLKKELNKNSVKVKTIVNDLKRTQHDNDEYIKNYAFKLKNRKFYTRRDEGD